MKNSKEFRIGNFYQYNGIVIKICALTTDNVYFDTTPTKGELGNDQTVIPIPLTEDWLFKFGFALNENGFEYNDWTCLSIWKDEKNFNGFLADWSNKTIREIKFVHQLQNLYFALTETELKIK